MLLIPDDVGTLTLAVTLTLMLDKTSQASLRSTTLHPISSFHGLFAMIWHIRVMHVRF